MSTHTKSAYNDELENEVFDKQNELVEDSDTNNEDLEEYKVTLFKSLTSGYVSEENYNAKIKWLDNFLTTEYNTLTKLFTAFKKEVFNKQ